MIGKIISFLLLIPVVIFLYLTIKVDNSYSVYMIPFVILIVLVFMFSPQIEWWWIKRNPPKINPESIRFFNKHFEFFQKLDGPNKDKFLERTSLFNKSRVFIPKIGDKVPGPIRMMIIAEAVRLTFYLEDYLMLTHERIVIYSHPFPTPRHRKMHNSETHNEDGVLIFNSGPVIAQFYKTAIVFNIVLYEWITAFRYGQKEAIFPEFKVTDWEVFGAVFNTPRILVVASLALKVFDMSSVGAVLYLTDRALFMQHFPEQGERFYIIFKQ